MTKSLEQLNCFVWGIPTLILILSVGLCLCFRTGFIQFRFLPRSFIRLIASFRSTNDSDSVTGFQALCTALAATVGTGNLVGVAGAIAIGGPGAVFWMWICAFLGMVIKYAEATLAVRFCIRSASGECFAGPMYMIQRGLGQKFSWLSNVYAALCVVAAFGVGNATQVNAVVESLEYTAAALGLVVPSGFALVLGFVLALLILILLLGGAKRIRMVVSGLVPFAAALYILLALGVLFIRVDQIPQALFDIVSGAFAPAAVTGGIIGSFFQTLRVGASRGVFTNEAGMGTAAIAHGTAQVDHPCEQGMMGIVEVFLDTIVICTLTALVILCSGVDVQYGADPGAALTLRAFSSVYGFWSDIFLCICLCCFAIATVIGWSFYGARCAQYLFGESAWKNFSYLQAIVSVVSVMLGTGVIWTLSEVFNGLMSIPNLIAIFILRSELVRLTQDYQYHYGTYAAIGGTNENFYQCKPV